MDSQNYGEPQSNRFYELAQLGRYINCIVGGDESGKAKNREEKDFQKEIGKSIRKKSNLLRRNTREDIECYEKIMAGDLEARRELIKANVGYLYRALEQQVGYACNYGVSLCDLFDGVIENIFSTRLKKYDPNVGRSLGSFLFYGNHLKWSIRRQIEIASFNGMVQVSKRKSISLLSLPSEGNSIVDELSLEDKFSRHCISKMQKELPTSADFAMHSIDSEKLHEVMATLSPNQRYVVEQYYFKNRTTPDIAPDLGITSQGTHYILSRALRKLRFKMRGDISLEKRLKR